MGWASDRSAGWVSMVSRVQGHRARTRRKPADEAARSWVRRCLTRGHWPTRVGRDAECLRASWQKCHTVSDISFLVDWAGGSVRDR
uniref:Uncharacterized protein n=1 Tax=Coptotermes formosanus TaxID=36987 RepID=R4V4D3_COPFO|nr:hypothetical protein [Coptotermes formosanus]